MNTRGTPNRRTDDNEAIQNVRSGPVKNQADEVLTREARQILDHIRSERENVKTRSGKNFWNQMEQFYIQLEKNVASLKQVASINAEAPEPGQEVGIPVGAPMGDSQAIFRKVCAKICLDTMNKINTSAVARVNTKKAREWLAATYKLGESGDLFKCGVCFRSFKYKLDFTKHLYMHRLKEQEDGQLWGSNMKSGTQNLRKEKQKCNECEESFDFDFELDEHKKKEHRPKRPHGSSLAVAVSSDASKRPKRKCSA